MRQLVGRKLRNLGQRLDPFPATRSIVPEASDRDMEMIEAVRPYTMTETTALWATMQAIRYVQRSGVKGDFVECGVWRGGNTILAGLMRQELGMDFTIRAFDTFAGMTAPTEHDAKAGRQLDVRAKFDSLERGDHNDWCFASIEDVRANFRRVVGSDDLVTIKGSVLDTLADPANLPERIAVLRLDTDFYDSTKIELEVLWPRLAVGGVLMVDDYGAWAGARKATDEYFAGCMPWLHRVDHTVRLVIKSA